MQQLKALLLTLLNNKNLGTTTVTYKTDKQQREGMELQHG